jgi:hypothetical protein
MLSMFIGTHGVAAAAALEPGGQWTHQFGTSGADEAVGMVLDAAGNAYVVGWVTGALRGQQTKGTVDAFVRRYDPAGNEVWTRQFGSWDRDFARAVAVDPAGAVYVVGETEGTLPGAQSAGGWDVFVRKYDPAGTELWTRQYGSGGGEWAPAATIDSAGFLYVAGTTGAALPGQSSAGDLDAFLMKLDPNGDEVWARQYGDTYADFGRGVSIGPDGAATVVGSTANALGVSPSAGGYDGYVRRFDAGGDHLWTRQLGSPGNDFAVAVTTDGNGRSLMVGSAEGPLPGQLWRGGTDAFVSQFGVGGEALWTNQFGTHTTDDAFGVAATPDGEALVLGNSRSDFYVRRYDTTGEELRTHHFGTDDVDSAFAMALDPSGHTYAAGSTRGTFPGQQAAGLRDVFVGRLAVDLRS